MARVLRATYFVRRPASVAFSIVICALAMVCTFSAAATTAAAVGAGPTSGPYEQTKIHRREGTAPATQPRGAATGSQNPWDMGKVPLALGGVVALIFLMRWLGKKMVPGARRRGGSRAVKVLVQSPLSARQQLMLVQVGRRLVLVGNSGSDMSALCQIKDPDEVAEVLNQVREDKSSVAKSFGSLIGRAGKAYEPAESPVTPPERERETPDEAQEEEQPTTEAMQEELTGLMERARRISKQFQGTT